MTHDPGTFHVIPSHDIMPHANCANCWCEPELIYVDPYNYSEVWTHRCVAEEAS